MNTRLLTNRIIIFWLIVLGSILIVVAMFSGSIIYQHQSAQAAATLSAVPTLTAQSLESHYQKGLGYINMGRWQEAKIELEYVFETDPNYKDIQAKLKEVYARIAELDPTPLPTIAPIYNRVSCKDIFVNEESNGDGIYTIDTDGEGGSKPFEVYCDMTTDGGGWTLFTVINQLLPDRGTANGDWSPFLTDQFGWHDLDTTKLAKKPAGTFECIRVVGTGWHIDMKTSEPTDVWRLDPCVEQSNPATIVISQENVERTPAHLRVHNNKSAGCTGIGHVYMGQDTNDENEKIPIKGVIPDSDGAFNYLLTFGPFTPVWPAPPKSSLGGWQTQCDPRSNDKHYRCSGFIDDPNWTGVYMYYR